MSAAIRLGSQWLRQTIQCEPERLEVIIMAHQRKLGGPTDQRRAMLRSLTTSFLENGRIETTTTRAKEVKKIAEKMVTLGKTNTLHTRRQALSYITKEEVVVKLFEEIAPKYADRSGGYTRVIKIGPRRGDAAEMSVLEFV